MIVRPGTLIEMADDLNRLYHEINDISYDIASVSYRLGTNSGMDAVQRRLRALRVDLEHSEIFAARQSQVLMQTARWYETCEARIQDQYEDAAIRFTFRKSAAIDVSFISGILH